MASTATKKKPDAPTKLGPSVKELSLALPADFYAEVEDYRFEHRIPYITDALRTLIRIGLDAGK